VEVYAVAHLVYQHTLPGGRLGKGKARRRHDTALPVNGGKGITGPAVTAAAAAAGGHGNRGDATTLLCLSMAAKA
jgi:hypothetical protein